MNFSRIIPALALMMLALSCSKEESFERRRAEDDPKGMLLVKVTQQSAGASYTGVNTLTYDENKKLIHIAGKIEGKMDGPYTVEDNIYFRNQRGDIDSILSIGTTYDRNGNIVQRDSTLIELHYTDNGQYIYGIMTFADDNHNVIKDSVVYTYDSKGRITQVKAMIKLNDNPVFHNFQVSTYAYDDKGNVSVMTVVFAENGQDPPQVLRFQYNDKLSPFDLGNEGKLFGFMTPGLDSPNGLINILDSEEDGSWDISYEEFNSANKPLKAVWTNLVTLEKINYTYYYQ